MIAVHQDIQELRDKEIMDQIKRYLMVLCVDLSNKRRPIR